jgi:hypothetical protein
MWLIVLLSGMSLFVGLFPYGDSLANRLALPLPVVLLGSSLYLLVGRRRGFIDQEQLSLFGRAWIVFATLLVLLSAQAIITAEGGTGVYVAMGLVLFWITIGCTILPAYLVAKYLFEEKPKR